MTLPNRTPWYFRGAPYEVSWVWVDEVRPTFGYAGGDPGEPAHVEIRHVRPLEGGNREDAVLLHKILSDGHDPECWDFVDSVREAA